MVVLIKVHIFNSLVYPATFSGSIIKSPFFIDNWYKLHVTLGEKVVPILITVRSI